MQIDSAPAFRFFPGMRFLPSFLMLVRGVFGAVPPEWEAALKSFRSDAPRGWSFNQTTVAEGKSMVEHCDGARPEFDRWSLVRKDGRAPTPDELNEYGEAR